MQSYWTNIKQVPIFLTTKKEWEVLPQLSLTHSFNTFAYSYFVNVLYACFWWYVCLTAGSRMHAEKRCDSLDNMLCNSASILILAHTITFAHLDEYKTHLHSGQHNRKCTQNNVQPELQKGIERENITSLPEKSISHWV